MSLITDAATSPAAHSAAGTLVPAAIWIGALAASTAVILLHTFSLGALRERLDELGQSRAPAPAPRSGSGAPMFGALYSSEPTLLDRVRAAPIPAITAVAVLLAALSGLLLLRGVGEARDLALSQGAVIGQMQAAHDSLSTVVAALRDSLRAAHTAPAAAAGAPASARARPGPVASAARPGPRLSQSPSPSRRPHPTPSPSASRAELPPAPSFESSTSSSR